MQGVGPGTNLGGRYTVSRRLSSSHGAERWVAQDNHLRRAVTILVFPTSHPQAEAVSDAARRAAGLRNPRLVDVLDFGREAELAYVVEEDISKAKSLGRLAAVGGLPAEEVRRLTGEASVGLEAARRRGLHHEALTPASVLRSRDGEVLVLGVATSAALAGLDEQTPEEASRTDAIGIIALAYAGLTGRWPLAGDPDGLQPAPRYVGGVPAPSEIAVGVPGDLDALCRLTLSANQGPLSPGDYARQIAPWSPSAIESDATSWTAGYVTPPSATTPATSPSPPTTVAGPVETAAGSSPGSTGVAAGATGAVTGATGAATGPALTSTFSRSGVVGTPPMDAPPTDAPALSRPAPAGPPRTSGEAAHTAGGPSTTEPTKPHPAQPETRPTEVFDHRPASTSRDSAPVSNTGTTSDSNATAILPILDPAATPTDRAPERFTPVLPVGSEPAGRHAVGRHAPQQGQDSAASGPGAGAAAAAAATAAGAALGNAGRATGQAAAAAGAKLSRLARHASKKAADRSAERKAVRVARQEWTEEHRVPLGSALVEDDRLDPAVPLLPAGTPDQLSRSESRLALVIVLVLLLVALVIGIWGASRIGANSDLGLTGDDSPSAASATSAPPSSGAPPASQAPAGAALPIRSVTPIDPEGDNSENPDQASRVTDGNADTYWQSEGYTSASFGSLKQGLGVVLDLGAVAAPRELALTLPLTTTAQIYVTNEPSISGATPVGTIEAKEGSVTVPLTNAQGRYVIVWYTNLSQGRDGRFRAALAEAAVRG